MTNRNQIETRTDSGVVVTTILSSAHDLDDAEWLFEWSFGEDAAGTYSDPGGAFSDPAEFEAFPFVGFVATQFFGRDI